MIPRILVVSEGNDELPLELELERPSALCNLVQRILNVPIILEREKVSSDKVKSLKPKGKSKEGQQRLLAWVRYGQQQNFDAVVIVVDRDGVKDRNEGIAAAQEFQTPLINLPRAIGLAIESFDAWMLADEMRLTAVTGTEQSRQPDPESLTDPKERMVAILNTTSKSEYYAEIAERMDLDRLKQRCPEGFASFHDRVVSLGQHLSASVQ